VKKLTPFRLRVLKAWERYFWDAKSREIAYELDADETKVSEAMDFIETSGWKSDIYGYESGEKIEPPKEGKYSQEFPNGWRILPEGADIPQIHREFLYGIGWAGTRRCHSTMTPMRAMVWGSVRAIATPVNT
jgi:hypothetical protein